jgi:hypothetical protein
MRKFAACLAGRSTPLLGGTAMDFANPEELLSDVERQMEAVPQDVLFNDSKYAKLRESWCAAMFGMGFRRHFSPCLIQVNDTRERVDVDFFTRVDGVDFEFQLVEAQEPGRRRGLEYKQFADGTIKSIEYEPERGRIEGPAWIRGAIEKKVGKNYSGAEALHLLVYANFSAGGLKVDEVAAASAEFVGAFASVWILTSLHMCSLGSGRGLPSSNGWIEIRSIEEYYR